MTMRSEEITFRGPLERRWVAGETGLRCVWADRGKIHPVEKGIGEDAPRPQEKAA
jgi:hypothetical protein